MIPVTKPYLPSLAVYKKYLDGIWERDVMTNDGPLVRQLENELCGYLGVSNLSFLANATLALQLSLRALDITGEVITTPYSYIATTSSIVWEHCTPVFADIDRQTLNIDPVKVEKAITKRTQAILATHIYGTPCDIPALERIAKKHGLYLIFDAAHCFGATWQGKSLYDYGDISVASFHATKLFHTVEGGAIIARSQEVDHRVRRMRCFGLIEHEHFAEVGINAKNSELHAAMGLCMLGDMKNIISERKRLSERYDRSLDELDVALLRTFPGFERNYAYYPVIFNTVQDMEAVMRKLNEENIFPRRYFFPSLNRLQYTTGTAPVAEDIAPRTLCLPLYNGLSDKDQDLIISIVNCVLAGVHAS